MTRRLTSGRGAAALVVVLTGALSGVLLPAEAAVRPAAVTPAAVVPCAPAKSSEPVPVWRQRLDHSRIDAAEQARIEREIKPIIAAASRVPTRFAAVPTVTVPVHIHLVRGTHKKDVRFKRKKARRIFRVLRDGFAGAQSSSMGNSGFRFKLKKITATRNDRWFHALPGTKADRQMHKRLHRGKSNALNIYIKDARFDGGAALLGVARFPWQHRAKPKRDGIVLNVAGLPGGRARGYNLGDTVIHETGHWLGLYHTFQGGCSYPNDHVADTPAEATPNYLCPVERNSCLAAEDDGPDPIHNFMDYSLDVCMNHFTPGQIARMHAMFARYRAR